MIQLFCRHANLFYIHKSIYSSILVNCHNIDVQVNQDFVRKNEVIALSVDQKKDKIGRS
jgi:hypothetical protein